MATRFQDPLGLLVLIRACDCKVKSKVHPAPQLGSADRWEGADPASLAAPGQGPSVSPVSPAEAFPIALPRTGLCILWAPPMQLLYSFIP